MGLEARDLRYILPFLHIVKLEAKLAAYLNEFSLFEHERKAK
jgi:hypothetical protein